jgi:hypothetical protein
MGCVRCGTEHASGGELCPGCQAEPPGEALPARPEGWVEPPTSPIAAVSPPPPTSSIPDASSAGPVDTADTRVGGAVGNIDATVSGDSGDATVATGFVDAVAPVDAPGPQEGSGNFGNPGNSGGLGDPGDSLTHERSAAEVTAPSTGLPAQQARMFGDGVGADGVSADGAHAAPFSPTPVTGTPAVGDSPDPAGPPPAVYNTPPPLAAGPPPPPSGPPADPPTMLDQPFRLGDSPAPPAPPFPPQAPPPTGGETQRYDLSEMWGQPANAPAAPYDPSGMAHGAPAFPPAPPAYPTGGPGYPGAPPSYPGPYPGGHPGMQPGGMPAEGGQLGQLVGMGPFGQPGDPTMAPPAEGQVRIWPRLLFIGGCVAVIVITLFLVLRPVGESEGTGSQTAGVGNVSPTPRGKDSPEGRKQARAIDGLLNESKGSRGGLSAAVDKLRRCKDVVGSIVAMKRIEGERRSQLIRARRLAVDQLKDGARMRDALVRSLGQSLAADRAYLQWGREVRSRGCRGRAPVNTPPYRKGVAASGAAQRAKIDFIGRWRPIAAQYRLTPRNQNNI